MRILVTGGAGFIGSARRPPPDRADRSQMCSMSTSSPTRPRRRRLRRSRPIRATLSLASTSATSRRVTSAFRGFSAGRGDAPCRRDPCRSLDRWTGGLHGDQCGRNAAAARSGARLLGRSRQAASGRASASITSRPTRFSARSAPTIRPSRRRTLLRSALALFGEQGRGRSSRQRLGPHLRPADPGDQLHQQLRAVSFSRKAHPADDHEGAEGRAPSRLRTGRERPRLAACRGPRGSARRGGRARAAWGKPISSAAARSGPNLDVVTRIARTRRRDGRAASFAARRERT